MNMQTEAETFSSVVPTKYWHKLEDNRVQCDVCPRLCKLHEGQRGMCFVRARQNDEVVLTTYGRSSGYCADPIEKKPLNHFLPGTPVLSFGTAGCNLSCQFCFHPDTFVATTSGLRRIADLFDDCEMKANHDGGQVGFPSSLEVWTRAVKTARVTKVFAHEYFGEILELKASCCPPILLTPNHKVFAAHRSNPRDVRQVMAGDLSMEHYLIIPKRQPGDGAKVSVKDILESMAHGVHAAHQRRIDNDELTDALRSDATLAQLGEALGYHPAYLRKLRGQLARGAMAAPASQPISVLAAAGRVKFLQERGAGLPEFLELTPDFAWLLGYYCAEGWVTTRANRPNSCHLGFSCGPHERHLIDRAAQLLDEILGAQTIIVNRRTTVTVECGNNSAARLFGALCGKGAKSKRVPYHIAHAPESVIRAFLEGYFAGDGYTSETHLVGGTVSHDLAHGLYELGLHLDLLPTFFVHQPAPTKRTEGREVSQSTTYIVKFKRDRYKIGARAEPQHTIWREAGGNFLVPLRRIERIPYAGMVYNLEVDDPDHSYLAPFVAVSNCQNWDISKSKEMDTLADVASPAAIARAAHKLACRSVAFTYNDPTIFLEYAIDVAQACRETGIRTVAVTAGYICEEPREEFYRFMDAANVDLKGFTERFYHRICAGHLQPVLDTLVYLKRNTDVWFEITTLLIPGENDSDSELEEMTEWVVENLGPDVPMHFTAFHPDWKMLDKSATPPSTLTRAREIAIKNGVRYAYTGNVHDEQGGSTYCHSCGHRLIGRDWYVLGEWNLADGQCKFCGARCAGVFESQPGTWGARRLPVLLRNFAS